MFYFAVFFVALVMTMALIPLLIRFAGNLQLLDQPGDRKVHVAAIPRVGGVGMVLGVLLPILLWVPLDQEVKSLLAGIAILFVFGILDDRGDLDYRLKFLGQFLAAMVVVGYGGIVIEVVPFFGLDPVSPWFSMPLTVIVIVAVTNSINLADGLDGLAAGTMLLSLAGMALLAYLADGLDILMVIMTVMGAIVGFLRFNTYPARVFMGDTGSQFLGFMVVTLLIMLTQKINMALNPALPLLLLGVPLFDTAFVTIRRIYYGKSPFVADKNHVHHQLLALNLDHYEAVVIIYLAQALFVASAVLLRYHSDLLIVSLWILVNAALAFSLVMAGRFQWQAHPEGSQSVFARALSISKSDFLGKVALIVILAGVSLLLFVGPLLADVVDRDFGVAAGGLFLLMLLRLLLGSTVWFISLRLLMFVVIAFVIYLLGEYPFHAYSALEGFEYVYFGLIVIALAIGARTTDKDVFHATPMDFLLILIMIGMAFIPQARAGEDETIHLVIKMGIMFYAVEFMLRNMAGRWNVPTVSALWALGVIAVRGLVL
jgi:UDP-GlcNAc:undecaprenyl-phosphate GlcNAc-1-phosphate transferase